MKIVSVGGVDVLLIRERGHGDGGEVIRYFVDQGDGTFLGYSEWWSDPATAKASFDAAKTDFLTWVAEEAARQVSPPAQRKPMKPRPEPLPVKEASAVTKR